MNADSESLGFLGLTDDPAPMVSAGKECDLGRQVGFWKQDTRVATDTVGDSRVFSRENRHK